MLYIVHIILIGTLSYTADPWITERLGAPQSKQKSIFDSPKTLLLVDSCWPEALLIILSTHFVCYMYFYNKAKEKENIVFIEIKSSYKWICAVQTPWYPRVSYTLNFECFWYWHEHVLSQLLVMQLILNWIIPSGALLFFASEAGREGASFTSP